MAAVVVFESWVAVTNFNDVDEHFEDLLDVTCE